MLQQLPRIRFLSIWSLGACLLAAPLPGQDQSLETRVAALVEPLIENEIAVGMVVGTLADGESWIHGYGRVSQDSEAAPDGRTVYEIGSVTKVFTGVLLADAAGRGLVALDTPVPELLGESVAFPIFEDRPIRLVDLSTQSSGLPRMPPDFAPEDLANPFADYSAAKLHASLGKITLQRGPGDQYEYSNLGVGLLGYLLQLRAGKADYETLVVERILDPLGMGDTRVHFTESMRARLAPPYDAGGHRRENWDLDALAGAGALRSTAADMLGFARANLAPDDSELGAALAAAQETRHQAQGGPAMGLGWHKASGSRIWHNGGTGGYRAHLVLDTEHGLAVVVLANTNSPKVDEVGQGVLRLLLDQEPAAITLRKSIEVDRALLEAYAGTYEFMPGVELVVTLEKEGLLARLTGQDAYRIYPSSPTRFFWRVVEAEVSFEKNEAGEVTALVLHQGGRDQRAVRSSGR